VEGDRVTLQGRELVMMGLGLAAPGQIGAGIHLRWSIAPSVGFPTYGFNLFRRPHIASPPVCVTLAIPPGGNPRRYTSGDLTIVSTFPMVPRASYGPSGQPAIVVDGAAELTITCTSPMRLFRVVEEHAVGTVRIAAFDRSVLVDSAMLAAPGGTAMLVADRITRVVITTESETGFHALCRVRVADDAQINWGMPLVTLNLPPDWTTAAARLPAAAQSRYEDDFPKLVEVIGLLPSGPTSYTATGETTPLPTFLVQPTEMLLLSALDPGIARMLGLYFQDTTAATGTVYDYRIVGNWTQSASAEYEWICYSLQRGTPPAVATPTGLAVEARPVGGGLIEGAPSANQVTAALTWTLPRDPRRVVDPAAAVLYNVARQTRRSTGWSQTVNLTANHPVLVTTDSTTGHLPAEFYVDGPVPGGDYRYQIQAIDIFGRTSPPSTPVAVTLADDIAPPPPVQIAGYPSQANGRTDVTVSWAWTADLRAQAGDADRFRVYYQTDNVRPLQGTLTRVVQNSDGTCTVTTDRGSVPDVARFVGGSLVNRGQTFTVKSIAGTIPVVALRVATPTADDGTPILPVAAKTLPPRSGLVFQPDPGRALAHFTLVADWSDPARWHTASTTVPVSSAETYALTLADLPLTTGPRTPVAYGFVGVATVDRAGNVGAISPPAAVAVAHAIAPATPAPPTGSTYATRADYHGRSRYTLTIAPSDADLYYDVYRALDAAILTRAGQSTADDATLLALADQHDEAFTRLDTRDAAGSPLTGTGAALSYTDTLPGTGRNRFVYKVQSVDLAGNRSALSAGVVVHLIDVVPPRTPVVTRVTGGDRRVSIHWARNREPDLALYRLYRADTADAAADPRTMTLAAAFILDPSAATPVDRAVDATLALVDHGRGQLSYTDRTATALVDTYYRLVAVDVAGNPSAGSRIARARAYDRTPPEPPAFTSAEWRTVDGTLAITLTWAAVAAGTQVLLQRNEVRDSTWRGVSGWLGAGVTTYTDQTAAPFLNYVYRLRVKSAAGALNTRFDEITVTARFAEPED
jgi:hypothetical protein